MCLLRGRAGSLKFRPILTAEVPVRSPVRFVVYKMALGQLCLAVLRFSRQSLHPLPTFIAMLLVPKAREPSTKQCCFGNQGTLGRDAIAIGHFVFKACSAVVVMSAGCIGRMFVSIAEWCGVLHVP